MTNALKLPARITTFSPDADRSFSRGEGGVTSKEGANAALFVDGDKMVVKARGSVATVEVSVPVAEIKQQVDSSSEDRFVPLSFARGAAGGEPRGTHVEVELSASRAQLNDLFEAADAGRSTLPDASRWSWRNR